MPPKTVHLKATYTSPAHATPQVFSSAPLSLSSSSASSSSSSQSQSQSQPDIPVAEKRAYLASLRAATVALQEDLNAALTREMEADAARAASTSTDKDKISADKKSKLAVDEVAEEENYGEEVPEDDDE